VRLLAVVYLFVRPSACRTGENVLKVWDALSGRMAHSFSNHQKTITALCMDRLQQHRAATAHAAYGSYSSSSRILSASTDQQVKFYDIATYKVTHTMNYGAPILSMALSASCPPARWRSCVPCAVLTGSHAASPKTRFSLWALRTARSCHASGKCRRRSTPTNECKWTPRQATKPSVCTAQASSSHRHAPILRARRADSTGAGARALPASHPAPPPHN
jgi:hypothetical protein